MAKLRKITASDRGTTRQDTRAHLLVVGAEEFRRAVEAARAEAARARPGASRAAPLQAWAA
jgi:hypothetical protein